MEISKEPYGVCLGIPAWNAVRLCALVDQMASLNETVQVHPLTLRSIVTPLIAGNTVILKTSETTPYTQVLWVRLLHEAGIPEGALSAIHIDPKDAPHLIEALISDKRIR